MIEKWILWKPELLKGYCVYNMHDTEYGVTFDVEHQDENKEKYKLYFKRIVDFVSIVPEGNKMSLFPLLKKEYGVSFLRNYDFYEVLNSRLILWVRGFESDVVTWDIDEVRHFVFMNSDDIIDVIARGEPILEKVNSVSGEK